MSVHVFVNLYYELKKKIKCEAVLSILSFFRDAFRRRVKSWSNFHFRVI